MKPGQNTKEVLLKVQGALIDDAAVTFTAADTLGYSDAEVVVELGATDIALTVCKLTECDTSGGVYTDVPGCDFSATLPSATDDNSLIKWYVTMGNGRKRFLKPAVTVGNGSTGAYVIGRARLSSPIDGLSSATDRGNLLEAIV